MTGVHRRGALARDGWETVVDESVPGWEHTGLRVGVLGDGVELRLDTAGVERIVVPLDTALSVTVVEDGAESVVELAGRSSVFAGPPDVLYLSCAATASIRAAGDGTGRVAVAESRTAERYPTRHVAAAEVPVELRGAGIASREVRNFGTPGTLDAARLIVCEVLTPAGGWSSYPPHRHDAHEPGRMSRLEEIYWFDAEPQPGSGADPDAAFGLFHAYGSPAGEVEIDAMVRPGDTALLPWGHHGPAVAAPGYDLYYLNVMAGPDRERVWLIQDDPRYAGIRDGWATQAVDPRLPFGKGRDR